MFKTVCLWLIIIGGINWGLVGLLNFNLVQFITMGMTILEQAIYIIVGLSAVVVGYQTITNK